MRYHINPTTGNPNKCYAKKACPFGDLNEDHYDSKEEAQVAFEKTMNNDVVLTVSKKLQKEQVNSLDEIVVLKPDTRVKQVKNLMKFVNPANILAGRLNSSNDSIEHFRMVQSRVDSLISSYSTNRGRYAYDEIAYGDDFIDPDGFEFLGSGTHRAAYLDEKSGYVYKIPVGDLSMYRARKLITEEQKSFALLPPTLFSDDSDLRYAKTYFFRSSKSDIPVIVQEYVDPNEYVFWDETTRFDEVMELFDDEGIDDSKGLSDSMGENIMMRESDEKIIFIDCLKAPTSYWHG